MISISRESIQSTSNGTRSIGICILIVFERFLSVNHGKSFVAHIGDDLNITVPKGLRIHTCVSSLFSIFDSF